MPDPFDHRPPFLGHVLAELMLDATLAERDPQLLSRYYDAMSSVAAHHVESLVNQLARSTTDRLVGFIDQFRAIRFLYDYLDDRRLAGRLNQVLRRVKLPPLNDDCLNTIADARRLLRIHADELLFWVERPERCAA